MFNEGMDQCLLIRFARALATCRRQGLPAWAPRRVFGLMRWTGSLAEILSSRPAGSFDANGGYAAYTEMTQNVPQIGVRSANGTKSQLSIFGSASTLSTMDASGEVLFANGGLTYIASPTLSQVYLGGTVGRYRCRQGAWYEVLDFRAVLAVGSTPACTDDSPVAPPPDGGVREGAPSRADNSRADRMRERWTRRSTVRSTGQRSQAWTGLSTRQTTP
jgi:hypothetical protein